MTKGTFKQQGVLVALLVAITLAFALNLSPFQQQPFPMADAAHADYYLKLDGVDGESTSAQHPGEIEIQSFSWGMNQTAGHTGGGAGAGKVTVHDMTVTKLIDSTTEPLMLGALQGRHFNSATISVRKAGS